MTNQSMEALEQNWMGIPHELGHYVYWTLENDPVKLRQRHKEIADGAAVCVQDYLKEIDHTEYAELLAAKFIPWIEEIFADIVGTILGGETFLQSLHAIIKQTAGSIRDLLLEDGSHPSLFLRPTVRAEALKLYRTPTRDWESFFKEFFSEQFGIQEETVQTLTIRPPIARQTLETFSREELLILLSGDPYVDIDSLNANEKIVHIPVEIVRKALQKLVGFLYEHAGIRQIFTNQRSLIVSDRAQAFKLLLQAAQEEAKTSQNQPYYTLLHPKVLEGGLNHNHGCGGGEGLNWHWHELGEHIH